MYPIFFFYSLCQLQIPIKMIWISFGISLYSCSLNIVSIDGTQVSQCLKRFTGKIFFFCFFETKTKSKTLMFWHKKRALLLTLLSQPNLYVRFRSHFHFYSFRLCVGFFFPTRAVSTSTPKLTHWPSMRYRNQLASPCVWLHSISVNIQFVRFVSNTNINISFFEFTENEKKHIRDEMRSIFLHTQVQTIFYSLHNLKKYHGFGKRFIRVE